jgi:hypothetical protein
LGVVFFPFWGYSSDGAVVVFGYWGFTYVADECVVVVAFDPVVEVFGAEWGFFEVVLVAACDD